VSSMAPVPWTEKYRPRSLSELVGNEDAKRKFIAWLNAFLKGEAKKKAALLYGPPGSGKTSLVHAVAHQFGWELIELNASDFRSREAIRNRVFGAATMGSLYGKRKIILIDEVDGISTKEDVGGLSALLELIEKSRYPVVLTANDPWDPKLRPLRNAVEMIEFKKLKKREIMQVLQEICKREGIECSRGVLSAIADNAKGDLRAAINDLQTIAMGKKRVDMADLNVLGDRAEQASMFDIVRTVLTARRPEQALAVLRLPGLDYEMLMLWLSENIPYQYQGSYRAIADAYEALSWADIMLARMKRKQIWQLLPYALELMTAGVASARDKPPYRFVKYSFPQKLKLLARTKNKREMFRVVGREVARRLHVSLETLRTDIVPFLRVIYENDPDMAEKIYRSLGLTKKEFEALIS